MPAQGEAAISGAPANQILRLAYLTAWRFGDDRTPPLFVPNPMAAGASAAGNTEGVR